MNSNFEFLSWFKANKNKMLQMSNADFEVGYRAMIEQAGEYKSIPEFDVMIAEMNRRSSAKDFRANMMLSIIAVIISLIGIFHNGK